MSSEYQVGLLGAKSDIPARVTRHLLKQAATLGLPPNALSVLDEADVGSRDRKKPFIAIFFGYLGADDASHPILTDLLADSVVIVPVVKSLKAASSYIPRSLSHINCIESSRAKLNIERIASIVFENFRLLRSERRLFISYRRAEAQGVAIQVYETLDALGFDVFLDTHGVPPAQDFQSVLWHRLADSDVVILLDTPEFRVSRWTVQELARANATSVQILHFLWPGIPPDPYSAFSVFQQLDPSDFATTEVTGPNARFAPAVINRVGEMVEAVRARAMAARYRYLVDNFCDQARSLNHEAAVQSTRFIALDLSNSRRIAVVPAIGVPNAQRYQEIEAAIANDPSKFEKIWLLYDERGILQGWLDHVDWLNRHLPVIAVRVSTSGLLIAQEAA
jgi:hypothetical protein